MIGGSGNRLAKIARTKSSPDIDAITSMGTVPYSIACLPDLSSMISLNTPRRHPDRIWTFVVKLGIWQPFNNICCQTHDPKERNQFPSPDKTTEGCHIKRLDVHV